MGGLGVAAVKSGFFAMYLLMLARQSGFEYTATLTHGAAKFPETDSHFGRGHSPCYREQRSGRNPSIC